MCDAMTDKPVTEFSDFLFPGPPTVDGAGQYVLRSRAKEGGKRILETGVVLPLEDAKCTFVEVVETTPIPNTSLRRCRTVYKSPLAHKGPARVNSAVFRNGWERIFAQMDETDRMVQ